MAQTATTTVGQTPESEVKDLMAVKYEIITGLVAMEDERDLLMIKKLVFGQNWPELSLEQEVELDMQYREAERGEGEASSWEEVRDRIRETYHRGI